MLIGLSHVAIRVTDIEKSLDFYLRIPGVEQQFRLSNEAGSIGLIYLRVGSRQFIELFPRASGPHERPTTAGYAHCCLEVDDIGEMHAALLRNGLTPQNEPSMGGDGSWQFWIHDPDENPIEFHQFTQESMQLRDT